MRRCADLILVLIVVMSAFVCWVAYRQYARAQREIAEVQHHRHVGAEEVVTRSSTSGRAILQRGRGQ